MTDRAGIVAGITAVVEKVTGIENVAPSVVLQGHESIDSLDLVEIAMTVEDELDVGCTSIEPAPDWTIDKIADAVIAAKETART